MTLGRFNQPDSIVPGAGDPRAWDRFAYVKNQPTISNDPTGHFAWLPIIIGAGAIIGAGINYTSQVSENYNQNGGNLGAALTTNIDIASIGESALAGAVIGLTVGMAAPVALGLASEALVCAGLLTGSTSLFSIGLSAGELSISAGAAIYGISKTQAEAQLHRPYIRQGIREEVENRAPQTTDGRFIDPNTLDPIDGSYDLGHSPGHEFWREAAQAKAEGLTQPEFNNRMNNPNYYQIENPFTNRSHRFEQP